MRMPVRTAGQLRVPPCVIVGLRGIALIVASASGLRGQVPGSIPPQPEHGARDAVDASVEQVSLAMDRFLTPSTQLQGSGELLALPHPEVVDALRMRVFQAIPAVEPSVRSMACSILARVVEEDPTLARDLIFKGVEDDLGVVSLLPLMAAFTGEDAPVAVDIVHRLLLKYRMRAEDRGFADTIENQTVGKAIDVLRRLGDKSADYQSLCRTYLLRSDVPAGIRRSSARATLRAELPETEFLSTIESVRDADGRTAVMFTLAEMGEAGRLRFGENDISTDGRDRVEQYALDSLAHANEQAVKAAWSTASAVFGSRAWTQKADGGFERNARLVEALITAAARVENSKLSEELARTIESLEHNGDK